jgi:hypothetical protein
MGLDGMIILTCDMSVWIGLIRLRIGTNGGLL